MIGTDLNLTLPSLTETMAENISRIRTCFASIEDSLTQKATPAGLDMTAPLDMQGNSLTDVASIVFTSGNSSGEPGSIFYYDGDWYLVDATGMIQITDAGQLNAAGIGGIGGDYGGINPAAVTFVDSSEQYQFTHDTGEYADLVFRTAILQGDAGTITLGVDAALTGDRDITFKSLPASGKSLLVYDAATSTLEDNNVTRATNAVLVTALDASGNIEAASFSVDSDRIMTIPGSAANSSSTSHTMDTSSGRWTYGASAARVHYPLALPVGAIIKSARVYCTRNGGGTMTMDLVKISTGGGITVIATDANNAAGPASFTLEVTGLSETVVNDGTAYALRVDGGGTTGQFSGNASVTLNGKV